jgi:two-component system, cell cycle sensor histidine kinase and response regulator CckA
MAGHWTEAHLTVLEQEYEVTVARSGEAVLEKLAGEGAAIDLVLSDVSLPGITGYELCRRIKSHSHLGRTPVVLVISPASPVDIIRGLEAGADNYIIQPFQTEHLLDRLRRVLANHGARRSPDAGPGVSVNLLGDELVIAAEKEQILDLLLSSVEDVVRTNGALEESRRELAEAHAELEHYATRMALEAHRSNQRYGALMRSTGEAIFVLDTAGCILEANPRASELLGRAPGELEGRPLVEHFAEAHRDSFAADLASGAAGRSSRPVERILLGPDGAKVWCEVTVSTASVESEQLVLVVAHDITDRKGAEHRLEESQQHFASLFQYNPDAVYALDLQGRFTSANPECRVISGFEPDELIGESFEPLVVPEDLARVTEHFRLAAAGEPQIYQTAIERRGGQRVELSVTNSPIVIGGEIRGVFGIAEDVTEAHRAQERLRRSEELLSAIIDASPAAIITVDLERRVRIWNPAAEEIFGWSADEIRGQPLPIVPEDRQQESERLWSEVMEGREIGALELTRRRKDGTEVEISLSAAPLRGRGGELSGLVAVILDVSERAEAHEALRVSEEHLRQAQKMEAVGRLAGGVAHDFNNILTAIKGNVQLLLMDAAAEDPGNEELAEIDLAVNRATNLTRQLLTFSRREIVETRLVDLNELIRGLEKMLQRVLREDIQLRTQLDAGLLPVLADPGHLEQVLMNLVVNAGDAMPRGGSLTITTEMSRRREPSGKRQGERVILRVADTGHGIPAEIRAKVFEPFFTTKPQGQGTGLGLSTVYGIVQQWNGEVALLSREGEGTEVRISLPMAEGDPSHGTDESVARAAGRPSMNVLLIEDELSVRSVVQRLLKRNGHNVVAVETGHEAIELCERKGARFDLMISDVVMPHIDGPQLASKLQPLCPEMRVLFISGYSEDAISTSGILAAGIDFIQKPFSMEALIAKIDETCR